MKMSHIDDGTLHTFLDGECTAREREQIEQHLSGCDVCRERLEEAKAIGRSASDLLAELEPGPIHPPTWQELEERALARRPGSDRRRWIGPSLAWAAAILVAFGLGWFSNSQLYQAPRFADPSAPSAADAAIAADRIEPVPESLEFRERVAGEEEAEPIAQAVDRRTLVTEQQPTSELAADRPKAEATEPAAAGRAAVAEGVTTEADRERVSGAVAARDEATQPPAETPAARQEEAARRDLSEDVLKRTRPEALADEARPQADVDRGAQQRANLQDPFVSAAGQASPTAFFSVQPNDAALWLGGELREISELQLVSVEVGPGGAVAGSQPGLPVAKLTYTDAAGHVLVLFQQLMRDSEVSAEDREAALVLEPSGMRAYRWHDDRGYRLILMGTVSGDSLRALADRVN
jgi:anti-sigma factor RsiW